MTDEVYMDIDAVEEMSNSFGQMSEILQAVEKTMEVVSATLKASALVGLVGGYAVATYIDRIKPRVKAAAEKMNELKFDLLGAITSYRDGDQSGSQRFV